MLLWHLYLLESDDAAVSVGWEPSASSGLPLETSFFNLWLLYAATPAMAA